MDGWIDPQKGWDRWHRCVLWKLNRRKQQVHSVFPKRSGCCRQFFAVSTRCRQFLNDCGCGAQTPTLFHMQLLAAAAAHSLDIVGDGKETESVCPASMAPAEAACYAERGGSRRPRGGPARRCAAVPAVAGAVWQPSGRGASGCGAARCSGLAAFLVMHNGLRSPAGSAAP